MSETILPCPFCGAPASIEELPNYNGVSFSVGCDSGSEAECMGYQSLTAFNTRGEAIKAWNKRDAAPALLEAVETMHAALEKIGCICTCEGEGRALGPIDGHQSGCDWDIQYRALARVAGLLGEGREK